MTADMELAVIIHLDRRKTDHLIQITERKNCKTIMVREYELLVSQVMLVWLTISRATSQMNINYWLQIYIGISNNPGLRLKHLGVQDGSDGSGGTSYPLTENQMSPVAQAAGRVAYIPCGGYFTIPDIRATRRVVYYARRSGIRLPLLSVRNVVTYTHHQSDTYVTLFAGVAVMQ